VASNNRRGAWWAIWVLVGSLALLPRAASAHPLGNFSVNRYSGLRVETASLELRYVLDLAEIPTFQELQQTDVVTEPLHSTARAYAERKAEALSEGLRAEVDGRRLGWRVEAVDVAFPAGAGALPTLRLDVRYRAPLPDASATATLLYRDTNYGSRAGWKEIVAAAAPGVSLVASTVPSADRSRQLADYPADLLNSPPQDTEALIAFSREVPGLAVLAPPARRSSPLPPSDTDPAPAPTTWRRAGEGTSAPRPTRPASPRDRFTELMVAPSSAPGFLLVALAVAAALGALHALEPGHGKTMVAAYLVGSRGTARHAVLLGFIVTASHTVGVYALGLATLYASRYFVPERIYPWLAVVSGLTIAVVGIALLRRRCEPGRRPDHADLHGHTRSHGHDHGHGHDHPSQPGRESHGHPHAPGRHTGAVSPRQLVALGVTGGIVPCPGALVVLLSALALGRVGLGLALIVAFSAGLAAVLIVLGLLVVWAGRAMTRGPGDGMLVTRWLPLTSAAVMVVIGVTILVEALRQI
jgi:nickel/cobalt exporter